MVLLSEGIRVSDVGDHLAPEAPDDRSTTPGPDQRRPLRLGPGPLRLPHRERQPLWFPTDRRVLLADALALLRRTKLDARQGQARRCARLGPRDRPLGADRSEEPTSELQARQY